MPPVGFEPTILAGERLQTYALDRAAAGTGTNDPYSHKIRSATIDMSQNGLSLLQQSKSKSNVHKT